MDAYNTTHTGHSTNGSRNLQIDRSGDGGYNPWESSNRPKAHMIRRYHGDCEGGMGTPTMLAKLVWPWTIICGGDCDDDR